MRSIFIIITSVLLLITPCSAQFFDDFEDGELMSNPFWTGEITKFEVLNGQLRLSAPAENADAHLATSSKLTDSLVFSGDVRLGFNPSSVNFLEIFITADQLMQPKNGLYIKLGGSEDAVSLILKTETADQLLCKTEDGFLNQDSISLTLNLFSFRDSIYLEIAKQLPDTSTTQLSTPYPNISLSNYFVLHPKYTSTRANKFYFDNLLLNGTKESNPPHITSVATKALNELKIAFNEDLDTSSINHSSVVLGNLAATQISINQNQIVCTWDADFINEAPYSLHISGFSDLLGNTMKDTLIEIRFLHGDSPRTGDLIVSEIMADPSPSRHFPEFEFVEIYNRANYPINLQGLYFMGKEIKSPTIIPADSFLLICNNAASGHFDNYRVLYLEGLSNYFLANSGGTITLTDSAGNPLLKQQYDIGWHSNKQAAEGGISLAIRDLSLECSKNANYWSSSLNEEGASPGKKNLTRPLHLPEHQKLKWIREKSKGISLEFTQDFKADGIILWVDNLSAPFEILSDNLLYIPMDENNQEPKLINLALQNCSNHYASEISFEYSRAKDGEAIIFNEIMYDPHPGSGEYIELYNPSNNYQRLQKLYIEEDGNSYDIDSTGLLLAPNSYLLISRDTSTYGTLFPYYDKHTFYDDAKMPALSNQGASLRLMHADLGEIDAVDYDATYHFTGLVNTQGISLERINPNAIGKTGWTSAASSYNYGSPGHKNSQNQNLQIQGNFSISPAYISPDSDGDKDLCTISLNGISPNQILNLSIFDKSGNKVLTISEKQVVGTENIFFWKGDNHLGSRVSEGIYLVLAELTNAEKTTVYKGSITVLYK